MDKRIKLHHGDGGKYMSKLIHELFYKYFDNSILLSNNDSAVFETIGESLAFTTDSYIIKPLFFPGGDIGKLAVCGTANDLAVAGAKPLYLSVGFIIEEGFLYEELERIVQSMSQACKEIGIKVITGDTKVVEKGSMDGIFINTSGIGLIENDYSSKKVAPGDHIIMTGGIAEHGAIIALKRHGIKAREKFISDCGFIYNITEKLVPFYNGIKLMKDPTRGGIATALNEIAERVQLGIHVLEHKIPLRKDVSALCRLLGIDPLYLACEGRAILVVEPSQSEKIIKCIRSCENGRDASIIGNFTCKEDNSVTLETPIGGERLLYPLDTPMLPRIC